MWGSLESAVRRLDRDRFGTMDAAALLQHEFGPTLFIHLSRNDKIAQAVSLLRAEQSGLWHLAADGSPLEGVPSADVPAYDHDRLVELVADLENGETSWVRFFETQQIKPIRLAYESLTADPQSALAAVLSALDRDPEIARTIATPTAKMADSISRHWCARFEAEKAR